MENDTATRAKDTLQSLWRDVFCTGFSSKAPYQSFVERFGRHLPSQDQISAFLTEGELYAEDEEQWSTIPKDMSHSDLVLELQQILQGVMDDFEYGSRAIHALIRDELLVPIHRPDKESDNIWEIEVVPDLIITGEGSAYRSTLRDEGNDPNSWDKYMPQTSSVIMVRTCDEVEDPEGSLKIELEAAFYAQQCFKNQGNRLFCLVLLVTEEWAKLFYYDRGGCLQTRSISIHDSPEEFVWYLLLISCPNDEVLGFDKRIRWNAETQVHTITTVDEDDNEIEYRLANPEPLFSPPEWEMLKRTKGAPGVVQMVSYESGCSLKCLRHPFRQPVFVNRVRVRITLKAYGGAIDYCENGAQLLYAFHDAVAGHQKLWDRGILHRDISLNNILLGNTGAPVGERGIAIDLDIAVLLEPDQPLPKASADVGTLGFMSAHLLSFSRMTLRLVGPPKEPRCDFQTHLDDLWSFFYCLCWTCFGAEGTRKEYYEMLDAWEDTELTSFRSKCKFLSGLQRGDHKVPFFFGPVFDRLILDLYNYLDDIEDKFHETLLALADDSGDVCWRQIDKDAKKHYEGYLKVIDTAIGALENELRGEAAQTGEIIEVNAEEAILLAEEPELAPLRDVTLNTPHGKRKRELKVSRKEGQEEENNQEKVRRKVKEVKEVENFAHEDRVI
ncbi:unnamed protein product [Cyclocybe aegerita]|uniref:Fungal-type protein kinase domain-containing protein n=1 Tax=Cyclocybe aegerita TaxID=1973307 RepID=A0A8S0WW95_CYCAE|nr:unnamed protein product [Cyclocybe aegerita]